MSSSALNDPAPAAKRSRRPGPALPEVIEVQAEPSGAVGRTRFEAVMAAAERSGLLQGKKSRIAARVNPALMRQAKKMTGVGTDTELLNFALASLALEDNFADAFRLSRGTVDPDLKLGF